MKAPSRLLAASGKAWNDYTPGADYGVVPMDLPKVAACISAGLPTQLYHVAVRNNAFDTHVAQPALHQRLLSYVSDAVHGFVSDMQRIGQGHRVVVMLHSEFGRRPMENANLGTDHGSSNIMLLAGAPVQAGHFGEVPSLVGLQDGDNVQYTTDFRQVYASVIEGLARCEGRYGTQRRFCPVRFVWLEGVSKRLKNQKRTKKAGNKICYRAFAISHFALSQS